MHKHFTQQDRAKFFPVSFLAQFIQVEGKLNHPVAKLNQCHLSYNMNCFTYFLIWKIIYLRVTMKNLKNTN